MIFTVNADDILLRGKVKNTDHEYIIYISSLGIHINSGFTINNKGNYDCLLRYDRYFCKNKSDFEKLRLEEIETQAYNAYMDGTYGVR